MQCLEKSVQLDPDNLYASCKLVEVYYFLSEKPLLINLFGILRPLYRDKAKSMLLKAENIAGLDYWRIVWLKEYYGI
jgi:hypothetical protein